MLSFAPHPPFSAPPPSCGPAGYYGAAVEGCAGLVKRCGALTSDGSCDPTTGGYNAIPMCIPCGNGICEPTLENRCNCPADCR